MTKLIVMAAVLMAIWGAFLLGIINEAQALGEALGR